MKQRLLFLICMAFGGTLCAARPRYQPQDERFLFFTYLAQTLNVIAQPNSSHRTSTPEARPVPKSKLHGQSKQAAHARNNSMRKRIIQQPCKIQKASHVRYKTL